MFLLLAGSPRLPASSAMCSRARHRHVLQQQQREEESSRSEGVGLVVVEASGRSRSRHSSVGSAGQRLLVGVATVSVSGSTTAFWARLGMCSRARRRHVLQRQPRVRRTGQEAWGWGCWWGWQEAAAGVGSAVGGLGQPFKHQLFWCLWQSNRPCL